MIQEARDHANRLGLVPPFFDQSHYNMLHRDRELKPVFSISILRKSSLENADSLVPCCYQAWRLTISRCTPSLA